MTINRHKAAWAARKADECERNAAEARRPHRVAYLSDRQYARDRSVARGDAVFWAQEALRFRKLQARFLGVSLDDLVENAA